jgi:histidine decarboxylase
MRSNWLADYALSAADSQRLDDFYGQIQHESDRLLGYPCNNIFDYSPLFRFLGYAINNVGDPYLPSNYHLNTHEFEREVIEVFQQLTQAPAGATWGYVTNGGTEGNHYGLFLARELLPGGIVYYSQAAHYSIDKILRCLNLHSISIRSLPDGTMDLDDLRETLRIHRDVPAIVCATIGTTMKGAVDDIAGIKGIFYDLALPRHYLHADGALGGMILPFIDRPPAWNFAAGIDSISISGHKAIGSPIPCGVVLAKQRHVDRIAQSVEYIDTLDTTLSGSRNAITPLFLWYAFRTIGIAGFGKIIPQCLQMADYAIDRLNALDCHAWRHPYSNTVVFDRPPAAVTQHWQLACQGNISHLIAMPHVTTAAIDALAADIRAINPELSVPVVEELPTCEYSPSSDAGEIILMGSADNLLTEVAAAFATAGISIEDVFAARVETETVVKLKVSDRQRAIEILNRSLDIGRCYGRATSLDGAATKILDRIDYQAVSGDAILIELEDRPGTLALLMKQCRDRQISLRSVRLLWRGKQKAVVELAAAETEALKLLLADRVLIE